jgi:uncharacterized protein YcbK (DUF882 family)
MLPRRKFICAAGALAGAALLPTSVLAQDFWSEPRSLWLIRANTQEEIRQLYWHNGTLNVPGYSTICHLLRDVRGKQTVQMDLVLLDILRGIQGWFEAYGIPRPIIINSAYRTRNTNEATEGAARNSFHVQGRAADIRIPDVPSEYLARLGMYLSGGGVGFYPSKGFIHIDSGRLRFWKG